jgi:hypothetical protein
VYLPLPIWRPTFAWAGFDSPWLALLSTELSLILTMSDRITRLPSQATNGNDYGRRPNRRQRDTDADIRRREAEREAYLIDGWQDDRRY